MLGKIKILDCTLRDGGYYNNWDFDKTTILNYVKAINKSGIQYVEVGFRFNAKDKFFGPFAFSSDRFVKELNFKIGINLALMVNASDLINSNVSQTKIIDNLFTKKKFSPFKILRIAVHFHEVPKIINFVKHIKKKGYKVFVNLMQASNKTENEFEKAIKFLKKSNSIEVLYIADSLGAMNINDVREKCSFLKKYWNNDFGIHAHNNCNLALKNSLEAIKCGATWVDSTILGMGRGAGNVSTEKIIKKNNYLNKNYNSRPLEELSKKYFSILKNKFKWGPSKAYQYAAQHKIHPSYVQVLKNEVNHKNDDKIINILDRIRNADLVSYNPLSIQKFFKYDKNKGLWDAKGWCKEKKILILGKGPSLSKYKKDLELFIKINKPLVLSLNFNNAIKSSLINFFIVSNQEKIILDFKKYYSIKKKIIIPKSRFEKIYPQTKYKKNFFDYGLSISKSKIKIQNNYCSLPSNIVLFYALSLAKIGGARKIFLAGLDGYSSDDPRQLEINKNINLFSKLLISRIICLTPTKYNIPKSSLYAHM
jgi:4-hydroxy 2-oxovalerate aldolase